MVLYLYWTNTNSTCVGIFKQYMYTLLIHKDRCWCVYLIGIIFPDYNSIKTMSTIAVFPHFTHTSIHFFNKLTSASNSSHSSYSLCIQLTKIQGLHFIKTSLKFSFAEWNITICVINLEEPTTDTKITPDLNWGELANSSFIDRGAW